ncbi:MAG: cytochrome c [Alphaproteobacteria bacterium]
MLGAGMAATQPAYADAVKDRRALMKSNSKANKAIKKATKAGDIATAKTQAMILVANADKIMGLFPKGTGRDMLGAKATRAKPGIWKDWDSFKQKAGALKSVAMKVAAGDMAAAKNIGKACGGCHKSFRGKKVKKK